MFSLQEIDTSKFMFDPKANGFVDKMEKSNDKFSLSLKGIPKKAGLIYMVLMYDPSSYFFEKESDIIKRKESCANIASFPKNEYGGFTESAINIMAGKDISYNDAIAEFLYLTNSLYIQRLAVLEINYERLIRQGLDNYDREIDKTTEQTLKSIVELRNTIWGGKESHDMHKALSKKVKEVASKELRREAVVEKYDKDGLKDWNPYGKQYKIPPLRFLGDREPSDENFDSLLKHENSHE